MRGGDREEAEAKGLGTARVRGSAVEGEMEAEARVWLGSGGSRLPSRISVRMQAKYFPILNSVSIQH